MAKQYYNGQVYEIPDHLYNDPWYRNNPNPALLGISSIQAAPPQAPAPTPAPQMNQLQPQFNKLTGQARDALYGGLLGYQAPALTSGGSNPQSFAAPQGGFRFPFGLLNQG